MIPEVALIPGVVEEDTLFQSVIHVKLPKNLFLKRGVKYGYF